MVPACVPMESGNIDTEESAVTPLKGRDGRISSVIIKILAAYTAIAMPAVILTVLLGQYNPMEKAIMLMASGLILIWVVAGGILTLRYRDRLKRFVLKIKVGWGWKFFFFCILMAMLEEAITTTMTNLAPLFGSQIGVAYITASSNYFIVISFSSVVVFIPEFAGWTLLLRRISFSPPEVFLLYGLLGTAMEALLNPSALIAGFWFFVYGLMVYLPAYTLPERENSIRPRWYHYPAALAIPLALAMPVAIADILLAHALGITLWPAG